MSKQNSEVKIVIIGNNSIDGVRYPEDRPFRIVTGVDENGEEKVEETYRDDPEFLSHDYERRFNQMRAETIKNSIFKDNPNAYAISREVYTETHRRVKLNDPGQDPVGITIIIRAEKNQPREKSKTVRFL